jgi:hypothetical protein
MLAQFNEKHQEEMQAQASPEASAA